MLDRKFIVENAALVKENCARRNSKADIDRFVELEMQRRQMHQQVDELSRQANETSKLIGKAKTPEEREALKAQGRVLRDQCTSAGEKLTALEADIDAVQRTIPNMSHPAAPIGGDDQANLEVKKGKHAPPKFDFKPLDHVELGEKLNLIDFDAGANTTGAGFYFLKNDAVLLELALQQYAIHLLMGEGLRDVDTVARVGGDEFVVVLSAPESAEAVEGVIRRIIDAVGRPVTIAGREVQVGCSVGIALYPDHGTDQAGLLRDADTAMYIAKAAGRNGYHIHCQSADVLTSPR